MPELRRWIQFLTYAGISVCGGVLFVKYGLPSDEKFIEELSPELKAQYLRDKAIRERADGIMQQKISASQDNPAWLEGMGAMKRLDRQVLEQARKDVEQTEKGEAIAMERNRLKELAKKEN